MYLKIKNLLLNQRFNFLGLTIFIIFVLLSFVSYSIIVGLLSSSFSSEKAIFVQSCLSSVKIVFFSFATVIGIITVGLILYMRSITFKPIRNIKKTSKTLSTKDCDALMSAMTELAQGNLSTRLDIKSKLLPSLPSSGLEHYVETLNTVIKTFSETAKEFNSLTDIPCSRLCYIGADSISEGYYCGKAMANAIGNKGEVAIMSNSFIASGAELRRKGFQNVLREEFSQIKVVEILETQGKAELIVEYTKQLLQRNPNLSGIYLTEGSPPPYVARTLIEIKKEKQVKIVCHDLLDETMRYLQKGIVAATLASDPFVMGHDSVIHLFNHLVDGWKPSAPLLFTAVDIVDINNYQQFWEEGTGIIRTKEFFDRQIKPVDKESLNLLRIAVVAKEGSDYWIPIKEGVDKASEELQNYNAVVDWFVPKEKNINDNDSADIYGPIIESIIEEKYDGLAVIIFDKELVSLINKAVDSGISVITFDSEPSNLRGLIVTIIEQAQNLMNLSENLAGLIYDVNLATSQINRTMDDISQGASSQTGQVNRTRETLESLLDNINHVSRATKQSAQDAERSVSVVSEGSEAMESALSSMQSIETLVKEIWHFVQELANNSQKIDSVVELIDDIASRVNVLALNAAIEATRAGEYGLGFMVVANEVRALAKNTTEATKEVTQLIGTVQSGIGKVEKVMNTGLEKVQATKELTDKTREALGGIRRAVEVDQERMEKVARAMSDMQNFSLEVGEAMNNVASISEENSKAVTEVNSSSREISNQLEEVADLAQVLEDMARNEKSLLGKFTVDERS
jgi:methyl-accepting chemotaxis protein